MYVYRSDQVLADDLKVDKAGLYFCCEKLFTENVEKHFAKCTVNSQS